jgi:ribosomal protein S18 acetylase RimI-like enzyme
MVALMFVEPSRESVALAGSAARAARFPRAMIDRALARTDDVVFVAHSGGPDGDSGGHDRDVGDGDVVGFALVSDGSDIPPLRDVAAMAIGSMGIAGALAAAWRSTARQRVDLPAPPGGLHLVELQVHPRHRGAGIGGTLLDAVEAHARAHGAPHLSLTTGASNPARRLYERHGYEVVAQRSARRYARLTGIPGRVLMVKQIVPTG